MNRDSIEKIYIEPTSRCNFNCDMCPRNVWVDEVIGDMGMTLFLSLMKQASEMKALKTVFFGGVAEPMAHEHILDMVKEAKKLGVRVELISNGSLLDKDSIEKLLEAGLDFLWYSIDPSHNDSFEELTQESSKQGGMAKARENLRHFNVWRRRNNPDAEFGITFVAMKSNIQHLPEIINLGQVMGASEVKISNVIPYSREMQAEMLYQKSFAMSGFNEDYKVTRRTIIDMPVMDYDQLDTGLLNYILHPMHTVKMGESMVVRKKGYCRFVDSNSLFIRWDGEVSPCMALLHSSKAYLNDMERDMKSCSFGNIKTTPLQQIWDSEEYSNFRKRVKEFSFSPCTSCGICKNVESNEEDCFGNPFPTCGACLWAEGFAQCP